MDPKQNEFKFSLMRNFGSEQVSFTAVIHSAKEILSEKEIEAQIMQIDQVISKSFKQTQEREIQEKELLAEASHRRTEAVKKLDAALKEEMAVKKDAGKTLKDAERFGAVNSK
jgi:hypothetical protein